MTRPGRFAPVIGVLSAGVLLTCGAASLEADNPTLPAIPATQPASALSRLAASMKPGTFALLNQHGDDSGYSGDLVDGRNAKGGGVGSIFGYSQKAAYDPVADKVHFSGGAHDGVTETIHYDVATNRWTNDGALTGFAWGHSYDSNALNPAAREFYASSQLQPYMMRRYNLDTHKWQAMSQPDSVGFGVGEASAEYFPERDELLWVQNRMLGAWKQSTNTWRRIQQLPGLAFRSPVARYIPAHKCAVIIGGADTSKTPTVFSHAVYRYDRDGKITQLGDSPAAIKVYISRAVIAVDPASGDCLFLQAVLGKDINDFTGKTELWKFDVAADKWTQLDESVVPTGWWQENYPFAVVATSISRHGVIMFMSAAGARSKVYLYKGTERPRNKGPGND